MKRLPPDEWARAWNAATSLTEAAVALGTSSGAAKSYASKLRARGFVLQDFRVARAGVASRVQRVQRLRAERDVLRQDADLASEETFLVSEIMALRTRSG